MHSGTHRLRVVTNCLCELHSIAHLDLVSRCQDLFKLSKDLWVFIIRLLCVHVCFVHTILIHAQVYTHTQHTHTLPILTFKGAFYLFSQVCLFFCSNTQNIHTHNTDLHVRQKRSKVEAVRKQDRDDFLFMLLQSCVGNGESG